jgi:hypothetical protein
MVSNKASLFEFFVLIEINEKNDEIVKKTAITAVNSSKLLFVDLVNIFKEEITIRQNPNKFADVFKMCCEV